jgi:aminopeptidase-like protein
MDLHDVGSSMHNFLKLLWPINRSITGDGLRNSLELIKQQLPDLEIFSIPTGTKVFDWTIPKEWVVRDAYIIDPSGNKICSFKNNNLHLVGYSAPIKTKLQLNELQLHLHSLPDQPNAIPYVTSYYEERWGFCLSHDQRIGLQDGLYEVLIDSDLIQGSLNYGELLIKGDSDKEIFLSTYICHPSMANNELSGPTVLTFIAKWILALASRRFSYRIIFIPETIGSIAYLSNNIDHLKSKVFAGYNVTCVGDSRTYSYLPSRNGSTISDQIAKHVLRNIDKNYISYKWSDRGSDERQYCAPGVDLPIASLMRSKYGEYPEYHTSLDDFENVVTPLGLSGGYLMIKYALESLEKNRYPVINVMCEPQLGKRGLYPTLSTKQSDSHVRLMMDLITWSDGSHSILEIAELCDVPIWKLYPIIDQLVECNLISLKDYPS